MDWIFSNTSLASDSRLPAKPLKAHSTRTPNQPVMCISINSQGFTSTKTLATLSTAATASSLSERFSTSIARLEMNF